MAIRIKTLLSTLEAKEKAVDDYRKKLLELRELRKDVLAKLYEAYYREKDEAQRALIAEQIEKIRQKERMDNQ